jgi:hypothetical protein
MSFEDLNNALEAKAAQTGGTYVKLTKKSDPKLSGTIDHVDVRDKMFNKKVVLYTSGVNEGKVRKEWVFSITTTDGSKVKWAASENAQWAITGALAGRKITKGGHIQVEVTEDSVQGSKQAEYKVIYTDPVADSPFEGPADDDEPPF